MSKIYRVLGKCGRITVPYEIRKRGSYTANDILTFDEIDENTVMIHREKLCDGCPLPQDNEADEITLGEFLDGLSTDQKRAALVHLSVSLAKGGKVNE